MGVDDCVDCVLVVVWYGGGEGFVLFVWYFGWYCDVGVDDCVVCLGVLVVFVGYFVLVGVLYGGFDFFV